jgi:hypothetical protein
VNLIGRMLARREPARGNLQDVTDYVNALADYGYPGVAVPTIQQTLAGQSTELMTADFIGHAISGYKRNGVVFACMLVRQLVFSAIRFQYQRLNNGRPSELFGNPSLSLLEAPWSGGTTQDMLNHTIQDADLAGNAYWTPRDGELVRLRPDWVQVLLLPRWVPGILNDEGIRPPAQLSWRKIGYIYTEGGTYSGAEPVLLDPSQVAHYAPIPDPLASFRGMSWLTPVIRDIQGDEAMTRHKTRFFDNGATPNMVVKHPETSSPESVRRFKDLLDNNLRTPVTDEQFRTLHIGGGADVTVVGANLQEVEFQITQGHGETRIAAAAGVPPVIVGLSEGLQAATYSNYAQARRRFADGTMHPLWQNVAGSFTNLMPPVPPGVRLWYDTRDIPFLREDEKDAAQIALTQAQTMAQLVNSGYEPTSVSRAVLSGDFSLLTHTGYFSVQLRPPGEMTPAAPPAPPAAAQAP